MGGLTAAQKGNSLPISEEIINPPSCTSLSLNSPDFIVFINSCTAGVLNFVLGKQRSYSSSLIDMNPNPYISATDSIPIPQSALRVAIEAATAL